jgi:hypothetical protein
MKTVKMVKCEVCNEYHPVEDCEIAVIKVIKGKACKMPSFQKASMPVEETTTTIIPKAFKKDLTEEEKKKEVLNDIVGLANPDVKEYKPNTAKRVPPNLQGVFIGHDDPNFEKLGAKETRRV